MLVQAQCFKYEDEGIEIPDTLLKQIAGSDIASYPILGISTSTLDMKEMEFVLGNDVVNLRSFLDFTQDTTCDDSNGCKESNTEFASLSALAQAYKTKIDSSTAVTTKATCDEKLDFVGDCMNMVKFVADDERIDKEMMNGFLSCVNKGYVRVINQLKEKEKTSSIGNSGNTCHKKAGSLKDSGHIAKGNPGPRKTRIKTLGHI